MRISNHFIVDGILPVRFHIGCSVLEGVEGEGNKEHFLPSWGSASQTLAAPSALVAQPPSGYRPFAQEVQEEEHIGPGAPISAEEEVADRREPVCWLACLHIGC